MENMEKENMENNETRSRNFIEVEIDKDLAEGRYDTVCTRFPPEPNGYLHIGHAKSILLNYGLAKEYGGTFHMRFDDTNPTKEREEFVESIKADIQWLGADWGDHLYFASDYFDRMYEAALKLIRDGKAYCSDLSADQIREYRGTLTEPGKNDPNRERSVEENLRIFEDMKDGKYADGAMVLRAKIDMSSPNINMRDPILYRVAHMTHHNTGDKWCIYPMYDFAHPLEDALEGITHSLCSLEFEDHRPLYNWVRDNADLPAKPRQSEFARLNINHTVMSKRKLRKLVEEHYVSGWDDPRMPTLSGLRRRGYTPASIRNFLDRIGVAKVPGTVEVALLEHCLREDLNQNAPRAMAVLRPVRLTITNYPEGESETFSTDINPAHPEAGTRPVAFSRHLWIEREDFLEEPVKGYFRLYPGNEVRLKSAYVIRCTGCVKDDRGNVTEVLAEYDPATRGGNTPDGRRIKGTIHWVERATAVDAEVRLYDSLFLDPNPDAGDKDFLDCLNPASLETLTGCKAEAFLAGAEAPAAFQFLRLGYFCVDNVDAGPGRLVFNRAVSLKDSFKK